jgi:hypothetical protein
MFLHSFSKGWIKSEAIHGLRRVTIMCNEQIACLIMCNEQCFWSSQCQWLTAPRIERRRSILNPNRETVLYTAARQWRGQRRCVALYRQDATATWLVHAHSAAQDGKSCMMGWARTKSNISLWAGTLWPMLTFFCKGPSWFLVAPSRSSPESYQVPFLFFAGAQTDRQIETNEVTRWCVKIFVSLWFSKKKSPYLCAEISIVMELAFDLSVVSWLDWGYLQCYPLKFIL